MPNAIWHLVAPWDYYSLLSNNNHIIKKWNVIIVILYGFFNIKFARHFTKCPNAITNRRHSLIHNDGSLNFSISCLPLFILKNERKKNTLNYLLLYSFYLWRWPIASIRVELKIINIFIHAHATPMHLSNDWISCGKRGIFYVTVKGK